MASSLCLRHQGLTPPLSFHSPPRRRDEPFRSGGGGGGSSFEPLSAQVGRVLPCPAMLANAQASNPPLHPTQERDERTVAVMQLSPKCREMELFEFFDKNIGEVRDVRIIGRQRGIGYVEFLTLSAASRVSWCEAACNTC